MRNEKEKINNECENEEMSKTWLNMPLLLHFGYQLCSSLIFKYIYNCKRWDDDTSIRECKWEWLRWWYVFAFLGEQCNEVLRRHTAMNIHNLIPELGILSELFWGGARFHHPGTCAILDTNLSLLLDLYMDGR